MLTKEPAKYKKWGENEKNNKFMATSIGAQANPLIFYFLSHCKMGVGSGVFMSLSKMPSAGVIQPYHKIVFQISYNWIQTVPSVSDWLYPP